MTIYVYWATALRSRNSNPTINVGITLKSRYARKWSFGHMHKFPISILPSTPTVPHPETTDNHDCLPPAPPQAIASFNFNIAVQSLSCGVALLAIVIYLSLFASMKCLEPLLGITAAKKEQCAPHYSVASDCNNLSRRVVTRSKISLISVTRRKEERKKKEERKLKPTFTIHFKLTTRHEQSCINDFQSNESERH